MIYQKLLIKKLLIKRLSIKSLINQYISKKS